MTAPAPFLRTAALITSAALRDDDHSVRHLLHNLTPEEAAAATEGSLLAMAELVRQFVAPEAIQAAIRGAQVLAHETAAQGDQS